MNDRSKVLEGEHAALQKRAKEQETKLTNLERASLVARQTFAQSQQRSSEWEKKAREFEGEVERLSTIVEQAEQTRGQLDADYSLAKSQIEEHEAERRLAKVMINLVVFWNILIRLAGPGAKTNRRIVSSEVKAFECQHGAHRDDPRQEPLVILDRNLAQRWTTLCVSCEPRLC